MLPQIQMIEIGAPLPNCQKLKKVAVFPSDPQFVSDFPVFMHVSRKYGMLFVATKFGFVSIYELTTASLIFRERISDSSVFVGARESSNDGIYVIAKNGNVI